MSTSHCESKLLACQLKLFNAQDDCQFPLDYMKLEQHLEETYSAPMPWIGLYVAVASLVCTLAMAADVLHGFRHRKLWFPCKYFTLNAASLTVIAIAMKLPLDLATKMPGRWDEFAKHGSMAFMCTMMANFIPSLGTMGNKELLMNIIALGILVITVAVNVLIQINTGVVSRFSLAYLFVALMLSLLIMSTSLALKVPISKKILEWKYHEMHKRVSNDQEGKQMAESTFDKLMHDVGKYWIMAETGNPQFLMASSPTCSAAGAISLLIPSFMLGTVVHEFILAHYLLRDYESNYKWSVLPILGTQAIGVGVGTIAPIFRCFAALRFKLSMKWCKNHLKVFQIENYWIQMLVDWKQSRIDLHIGGHKCKILVHEVKNFILSFCIGLQIVIVGACKIIRLIPIYFVILFLYCRYCCRFLKRKSMGIASISNNSTRSESDEQQGTKSDLSHYVLQLQDEVELAKRTLKSIFNSMNRSILKAEKQQPNNLIKLLKKSIRFAGVAEFFNDQIPPLHSEESSLNCWSLPVVTLTSIAIALPNLKNGNVGHLLRSVSEGLIYVNIVEENLNAKCSDLPNIRKAANHVWFEVELYNAWLGNNLHKMAQKGKSSMEILQWLGDKAKNIMTEYKRKMNGGPYEDYLHKFIAANSMYRITHTILLDDQGQNDDEELFERLSVMIADILGACLTNLPRVILMKCSTDAIEKREQSVRAAARLLGQTKEILKVLQDAELPNLDPNQMAYIDEWRASLKHQNPFDSISSSSSETTTLTIVLE